MISPYNHRKLIMPVNPTTLIEIINRNKDKRVGASAIIENNPADLPIVPKLITDNTKGRGVDDEQNQLQINRSTLETIYNRIANVRNNNKNIIQLFPDIELAIQILVSSILSPKKMTDIQLNYRFNKNFILNPIVTAGILDNLKTYIQDTYKLESMLPDIVREALFTSGACVYAIISESAVDEVINADLIPSYSLEEYKTKIDQVLKKVTDPINLIDTTSRVKVDLGEKPKPNDFINYLASESLLHVTDNINILHYGDLKEKITSKVVKTELRANRSISTESATKVQYLDIFRTRTSSSTSKQVEYVKTKEETYRKNLGRPLITKLPTESVIPVFVPGNEKEHVGYFVLLDENGKPVTSGMNESDKNRLDSTLHRTGSQLTPVQKAYNNLVSNASSDIDINALFEMYKGVLERQLFNTVKSSLYGKSINVAEKNDIYFLMFSRALQDQKTSILYLPKELVVYFAFQYNEMGVGKSLLENLAVQSSMRAILLFAKVMAYAKQSIDVTEVGVSFDPNDTDPEKTMEQVQSSVLKLRQNFLPLGINNPVDLVNWIQRAGLKFNYKNNPRIPNVEIEFNNTNLSHTIPSNDLEEEFRKQSIIALGLPPETVDNSFSPEFAKTVVNNNILLSKRVSVNQEKLNSDITKFVSIVLYNDEDIRKIIKDSIREHLPQIQESLEEDEKALYNKDAEQFIEYYLDRIADNLYIELPKPEDTDLNNLGVEFDLYKENIDKVLDSVVSSEIFSENIAGELSGHVDTMRSLLKHGLLRKWMADNNFLTETLQFTSDDPEEVETLIATLSQHLSSTMRNSDKLLRVMKDFRLAVNKDLNTTFDGDNLEGATSSSSETSDEEKENEDDLGDGGMAEEDLLSF